MTSIVASSDARTSGTDQPRTRLAAVVVSGTPVAWLGRPLLCVVYSKLGWSSSERAESLAGAAETRGLRTFGRLEVQPAGEFVAR